MRSACCRPACCHPAQAAAQRPACCRPAQAVAQKCSACCRPACCRPAQAAAQPSQAGAISRRHTCTYPTVSVLADAPVAASDRCQGSLEMVARRREIPALAAAPVAASGRWGTLEAAHRQQILATCRAPSPLQTPLALAESRPARAAQEAAYLWRRMGAVRRLRTAYPGRHRAAVRRRGDWGARQTSSELQRPVDSLRLLLRRAGAPVRRALAIGPFVLRTLSAHPRAVQPFAFLLHLAAVTERFRALPLTALLLAAHPKSLTDVAEGLCRRLLHQGRDTGEAACPQEAAAPLAAAWLQLHRPVHPAHVRVWPLVSTHRVP